MEVHVFKERNLVLGNLAPNPLPVDGEREELYIPGSLSVGLGEGGLCSEQMEVHGSRSEMFRGKLAPNPLPVGRGEGRTVHPSQPVRGLG